MKQRIFVGINLREVSPEDAKWVLRWERHKSMAASHWAVYRVGEEAPMGFGPNGVSDWKVALDRVRGYGQGWLVRDVVSELGLEEMVETRTVFVPPPQEAGTSDYWYRQNNEELRRSGRCLEERPCLVIGERLFPLANTSAGGTKGAIERLVAAQKAAKVSAG